jgi:hypothetical protein
MAETKETNNNVTATPSNFYQSETTSFKPPRRFGVAPEIKGNLRIVHLAVVSYLNKIGFQNGDRYAEDTQIDGIYLLDNGQLALTTYNDSCSDPAKKIKKAGKMGNVLYAPYFKKDGSVSFVKLGKFVKNQNRIICEWSIYNPEMLMKKASDEYIEDIIQNNPPAILLTGLGVGRYEKVGSGSQNCDNGPCPTPEPQSGDDGIKVNTFKKRKNTDGVQHS